MELDLSVHLSGHLADLKGAPARFSSFYRKLIDLRFPLAVAEVLELRSLFNEALEGYEEFTQADPQVFLEMHRGEFAALGIDKTAHADRLARLIAVMRELHLLHSNNASANEQRLQQALEENLRAQQRSARYGRFCLATAVLVGIAWMVAAPHSVLLKALGVATSYLFCDYFYSLSLLRREQGVLNRELSEVMTGRVARPNWRTLIRHLAVVLGYARIEGLEPFRIDEHREPGPDPLAASA